MEAFHRSIGLDISRSMGVRVENLELVQVQLPFLRADGEGKVCFAAVEQIKTVLKYFTEICQGEVLGAAPSLAVTEMEVDNISMT